MGIAKIIVSGGVSVEPIWQLRFVDLRSNLNMPNFDYHLCLPDYIYVANQSILISGKPTGDIQFLPYVLAFDCLLSIVLEKTKLVAKRFS